MNIIKLIKNFNLQRDSSCVFILRHAEKPITKNLQNDIANGITRKGVREAKRLGDVLDDIYPHVGLVRSSPIKRCVETANSIFSAYTKEVEIVSDSMLGGDGAYISDGQLAAEHFSKNPLRKDIFVQMQKGESFIGMREVAVGTGLLMARIMRDLENMPFSTFYITHDCILALFVGTMVGEIVDGKNWFNYLDGVCIKKLGSRIELYRNGGHFDITERAEELLTF